MNAIEGYIDAIKSDIDEFKDSINLKLDELKATLSAIQDQQSNDLSSRNCPSTMAISFDGDGCVIAATDGSLQFYGGVPRTSCAMFCWPR